MHARVRRNSGNVCDDGDELFRSETLFRVATSDNNVADDDSGNIVGSVNEADAGEDAE